MFNGFMPLQAFQAAFGSAPPTPESPISLLLEDFASIFQYCNDLPGMLLPLQLSSWQSGKLEEFYPSCANLRDVLLQYLSVLLQATFILSLPLCLLLALFFPVTPSCIWFAVFAAINWLICRLLDGPPIKQFYTGLPPANSKSDPANSKNDPADSKSDPAEKWFFINGIGAGEHWLQSNLTRLAKTFRREITGIQNPTKGILFDILECLIQRDLNYPTADIRAARIVLREALESTSFTKIVLLLHSQGGIEGAAAIDSLLTEVPEADLAKLEIYTFANAARHFHNPLRGSLRPATAGPPRSSSSSLPLPERVFRHIEHYANAGDFVAKIGVLKFSPRHAPPGALQTSYYGRVFVHVGATGHLLNQHYLDEMFRMDNGEVADGNAFMDSMVDPAEWAGGSGAGVGGQG